jgi:aspartyl-tRNA(Asn)/glutamyl-tRNA(Gln) amidotransferase subunit C
MSDKTISEEEVKRMAVLSNLDVSGQETKLAVLFTETLRYLDVLGELDTSVVVETNQVTGLTNVFQDTKNSKTMSSEEALSNAKEQSDGFFATKAVFDR